MTLLEFILDQLQKITVLQDENSCGKILLSHIETYKSNLEMFHSACEDRNNINEITEQLFLFLSFFIMGLLHAILKLSQELANKNNTINKMKKDRFNRESEKNRNTSDRKRDIKKKKKSFVVKRNVTKKKVCVNQFDQEIDFEEASKLIKNSEIVVIDGRKYKYVEMRESSTKEDIKVEVVETTYYKLLAVEVDDNGRELDSSADKSDSADDKSNSSESQSPEKKLPLKVNQSFNNPEIDFLKKTKMSIGLMSTIIMMWMGQQLPLNRISKYLGWNGLSYSRQMLYSYVNATSILLTPVYNHMFKYIADALALFIDETYWSCRERLAITMANDNEQLNKNGKSKRKSQRSKSKTNRTYVFSIITEKICLYFHSLYRNTEMVKKILIDNNIRKDAFVLTDAFYKKMFNKIIDENGSIVELFIHGLCWIHVKRYFCEFLNIATDTDGNPIKKIKEFEWDRDVESGKIFINGISYIFHVFNNISERCSKDKNIKYEDLIKAELEPFVNQLFDCAHKSWDLYKSSPDGSFCKLFIKAVGYLINNEENLKSFLKCPHAMIHNNQVEEKFRTLNILRLSTKANDTVKGADNTCLMYTLYKTCELHNVDFKDYLDRVIKIMCKNIDKLDLVRDQKNSIIGIRSHSLSDDDLDQCMPWLKA